MASTHTVSVPGSSDDPVHILRRPRKGVGAAIAHIRDVGVAAIGAHEHALSRRFLAGIDALPAVRLHGPSGVDGRTPTFAVTVDGHMPEDVSKRLAAEGIFTWAGHYYAVEPMRALGRLT